MDDIVVTYNGRYPNACSGMLEIRINGMLIYSKQYACYSTGCIYRDDDGDYHAEEGELLWRKEETIDYSQRIRDKVAEVLSGVGVCCGGCI